MTRILLDQGLAPKAAATLRQFGFDAIHVSEIGMEQAEDQIILDSARSEERVCITLDHDFHAHLDEASHGRPSVVLLRVQGLDAEGRADLIRFSRQAWRPIPLLCACWATGERPASRKIYSAETGR